MAASLACLLSKHGLFKRPGSVSQADWEKTVQMWLDELDPTGTFPAKVLKAGETLYERGDASGDVWLIRRGVIDEYRQQFRLAQQNLGDLVGECEAMLSPAPKRQTTARARFDNTMVLRFAADRFRETTRLYPELTRRVLDQVARHALDYAEDETQFDEAVQQYTIPGSSMLLPGPFQSRVTLYAFPIEADGGGKIAELDKELPPGVEWLEASGVPAPAVLCMASFRDFQHVNLVSNKLPSGTYDEINVFVPAMVDDPDDPNTPIGPISYVGRMLPDNITAVSLGREINGFPKQITNTIIDDAQDEVGQPVTRVATRFGEAHVLDLRFDELGILDLPAALPQLVAGWAPFLKAFGLSTPSLAVVSSAAQPNLLALTLAAMTPASFLTGVAKVPLPNDDKLKTTRLASWKRIFAPQVVYDETGEALIDWDPDDFDCDTVVDTPMKVAGKFMDMRLVQMRPGPRSFFMASSVFGKVKLVTRLGVRVDFTLEQQKGQTLRDYRKEAAGLPESDKVRLAWGFK